MKTKNIVRILMSLVLVFGFSSAWAKTIKWSMQGDSLTLDPHCLLYTSPSPRDYAASRMPSSA